MNSYLAKREPTSWKLLGDDLMGLFQFREDMISAFDDAYYGRRRSVIEDFPVNIIEDDKSIIFEALVSTVPNVSVENNMLKITAHAEEKVEEDKQNFIRREFVRSERTRAFKLPQSVGDVTSDTLEASYENGVLKIVIAKQPEQSRNFKVAVKASANNHNVLTKGNTSAAGLQNEANAQTATFREREGE